MSTKIHSNTSPIKKLSSATLAVVSLLTACTLASSVSAQTVIFQDDFSRTPTPPNGGSALAGTSPIIGAAYASGTYGTVFSSTTAGNPASRNAEYAMSQMEGGDLIYLGNGGDFGGSDITYGQTLFSTAVSGQGTVTVNFDFLKFNSYTGEIHIQSFSDPSGIDGLGFDIKLMANGQIAVNSGSGYVLVNGGGTIGGDIGTSFSLTADFVAMTFNATVSNDTKTMNFGGALNSGATDFSSMAVFATTSPNTGSNKAVFYMDNLLITSTAPIPEPKPLALMLGTAGIFALFVRRKLRSSQ